MPLVRFEVRNEVGLGDPELYGGGAGGGGGGGGGGAAGAAAGKKAAGEEEPKALLEGVAVAGLVGILRQLGDLAEFAADVFHDLHEQVIATSARGRKVLNRVQNIEAALPSLEKAVKNQKSHIHFAYVPGSDWHTQLQNEQNHLLSSDLPRFMMDSYEECRDPPRLYLLDKFDNAGAGACLKRYSDPSYFKKAWDMMRADKTGNRQREKKSHKFKRKGSRLREPHYGDATSRHRSGELQRSLTAVQLTNRQFGSSSTDGQSVSEHRSTPDARSNADNISRSSSFSLKTRLSSVEQALEMKPSAVPHENGHDKSSKINLHKPSDSTPPILLNGASVNDMGDNLKQVCLPHGMAVASPSVKWDEKAAIIMSTSSVYCDDVRMDKAEDAKLSYISSGQKEIEHREIDTLGQQEALLQKTKLPVLSSGFNHPDEVSGEADSYMDALNTLESETETENEFQTKNQVMSVPSFNAQAPQVGAIDNPDSPIAEFPDTCQDSDVSCTSERAADIPGMSNADPPEISGPSFSEYTVVPPNEGSCVGTNTCDSNADRACGNPSEVSELASPVNTAIPPNQGSPVCIEIPESNAKDGPGDFSEISAPGLSAYPVSPSNKQSSIVNQIPDDNTDDMAGDFVDEVTDNVVSQPVISNVLTDESFEKASAAKSSHSDAADDSGVVSEGKPQECLGMNHEEATEVCNSQSDTTVDSHVCESKPQECPEKSHEEATEASNSQSGSLNEPLESSCVIQDVPTNTCTTSTGIPSVKLWTNAGLFGLEPSKPPVFGAHDGPREDTPPAYKEPQHSHSTEYTESHCSKPVESAVVNMPNGSSSITSSFVGKFVGMGPGSANATSSGASQSAARTPDSVHSQSDVPSNDSSSFEHNEQKNITGKHTSISDLLASEESAENGAGPYSGTDIAGRNNVHMVSASSFSSIAQRFLANTLQRRTSPKYNDLPMSGRANNDSSANDESTPNPVIEPREAVLEESQIDKKTENGINGLSKSSTFSGCRYSEKSSPPLEYMKISFHPMSASEMSKLNLDFCDGNLHENSDDMMLPTFQLLSDTSIPHPGSGSESEDDTFGRSYSYSSYDDLSPRIYSNSEVWDQEDGVGLEEHELYDGSNQIGSATVPVSSYMGFEQMSLSGMKSTMSLADVGDQNGLGTLESHTVEELPNFETLMSTNDNRNGETTIPHNPVDLPLNEDQLPPPPPLPPMQWRMIRQTTSLDEERGTVAKDMLMNASSQTHVHTSAQEEHLPQIAPVDSQGHAKEVDVQKTNAVKEISDLPNIIQMKSSLLQQIRDKKLLQSDQLKMNGQEKSKAAGNDIKSMDEREELLQQIRSKTFNLRQTNASKTDTSQPTANSNVVAILEKANAIRQAVASDEGGDDDSWSDI